MIESIVLLVTLVVLFGPKRFPVLMRSLGQGIREFRRSLTGRGESSEGEVVALIPAQTATGPPGPGTPPG